MNIIMRCHVKNLDRLKLVDKSLNSLFSHTIHNLGAVCLVDNNSPYHKEVSALANSYGISYHYSTEKEDTKEGLYQSCVLGMELDPVSPTLYCVDDLVFGKDSYFSIINCLENDIPLLERSNIRWATVGLFACYSMDVRSSLFIKDTNLWFIPTDSFYAMVCHILNPKFTQIIIDSWKKVQNKEIPMPAMCDDLWVATLVKENNYRIFNTKKDYAQHTGMGNRTFAVSTEMDTSHYKSPAFVGE